MTSYVVLMRRLNRVGPGDDIHWIQGPTVEAVSAEAAIRKGAGDEGGIYVAVPIRSFAEVPVTVETKRTVNVG